MIQLGIVDNKGNIEPSVQFINTKWSLNDLATIIFFLSTGAYTEIVYEIASEKLNEQQLLQLNQRIGSALNLLGLSIDNVSDKAELDSAKQPVVSSEGQMLQEEPEE